MMNEKYLVWIDILGFEGLVDEIATDRNCESPFLRETIITNLTKLFDSYKENNKLINYFPHSGDSWILVFDTLEQCFILINDLMDCVTPFNDKIPFEMAIDTASLEESELNTKERFICSNGVISFLKSNLTILYNDWHKDSYHESNKVTFIICNNDFYQKLNYYDQMIFDEIILQIPNKITRLYKADNTKFQTRSKYLIFLEHLELKPKGINDRINDIFVPPFGYLELKSFLRKERVVFINGTPAFGKTYTSLNLLWEYFLEGYVPVFIPGIEASFRVKSRAMLRDIQSILKKKHIFYFEDPFGITNFEGENLDRDFERILNHINNIDDVYVIITLREEIIKQSKQSQLASHILFKYQKNLEINPRSYDYNTRKDILINWAKCQKCIWLNDKNLMSFVLESLKKGCLSTPLAIRDFCVATTQTKDENELESALICKKPCSSTVVDNNKSKSKSQKNNAWGIPYSDELQICPRCHKLISIGEWLCPKCGLCMCD